MVQNFCEILKKEGLEFGDRVFETIFLIFDESIVHKGLLSICWSVCLDRVFKMKKWCFFAV